ncbi:MAG: N-acylneuraminate cytidylyltransferase [Planctomycetota bacterium]
MTTVAFVPARGGSRGIPGKNLRPFCGRPLLHWCLDALQGASSIDRVVVATDCDAIAAAAEAAASEAGKLEVFRRSDATATDTASTESAILEFLTADGLADDAVFVLAQATSPFTRAADVDGALRRFAQGRVDALVSCARARRFYWSDAGKPINYDPMRRPRRQDFAGTLVENGALYVSRAGAIRRAENRISGTIAPFEMPPHTALELDDETDWRVGEALMQRQGVCPPAAQRIRMFLTDVDGVLTDGGMYYGNHGEELKKFNTLDGKAFERLRERGVRTGFVTGEDTTIVADRAYKVGADELHQGVRDKLPLVRARCDKLGIALSEVAYVGDDLGDLELLRAVGFAACPATAVPEVRAAVHYVCERGGGEGCVREVVDRHVLPRNDAFPDSAGHDRPVLTATTA